MNKLKTFKELFEEGLISEELHSDIKKILDTPEPERTNPYQKLHNTKANEVSKAVRKIKAENGNTGFENDKPKKGSSRAVYFPNEAKRINVDGKDVYHHTAIKIAFPGVLDKHTGDTRLLGEHQNEAESDGFINQHHSMLHEISPGKYKFNPNGVISPVLDHHQDHHWLEMSKAENLTKPKFTQLTKTESHPNGLKFDDFHKALENDHRAAHGYHSGDDGLDHVRSHPLFENMSDYMHNSGMHPGDMRMANMGVWKHPVTGSEHVVLRDHGFTNDIDKLYSKAWRNKYKQQY